MELAEDKIAREYRFGAVQLWSSKLCKTILHYGLPPSILIAACLYFYEVEPSNIWINCLLLPLAFYILIKLIPYESLLTKRRWIVDGDHLILKGGNRGKFSLYHIKLDKISHVDDLLGYYVIAVIIKKRRHNLILSEVDYPSESTLDLLFPRSSVR